MAELSDFALTVSLSVVLMLINYDQPIMIWLKKTYSVARAASPPTESYAVICYFGSKWHGSLMESKR